MCSNLERQRMKKYIIIMMMIMMVIINIKNNIFRKVIHI